MIWIVEHHEYGSGWDAVALYSGTLETPGKRIRYFTDEQGAWKFRLYSAKPIVDRLNKELVEHGNNDKNS